MVHLLLSMTVIAASISEDVLEIGLAAIGVGAGLYGRRVVSRHEQFGDLPGDPIEQWPPRPPPSE